MPNDNIELREAAYEAEASLIGAILLMCGSRKAIDEVQQIVSPADFLHTFIYRRIYNAMLSVDGPPNQISVAKELSHTGNLVKGDCAELSVLVARCPSPLDYLHYARVVKKYSDERSATPQKKTEINYY
jgi:replicative DNA helicase